MVIHHLRPFPLMIPPLKWVDGPWGFSFVEVDFFGSSCLVGELPFRVVGTLPLLESPGVD